MINNMNKLNWILNVFQFLVIFLNAMLIDLKWYNSLCNETWFDFFYFSGFFLWHGGIGQFCLSIWIIHQDWCPMSNLHFRGWLNCLHVLISLNFSDFAQLRIQWQLELWTQGTASLAYTKQEQRAGGVNIEFSNFRWLQTPSLPTSLFPVSHQAAQPFLSFPNPIPFHLYSFLWLYIPCPLSHHL